MVTHDRLLPTVLLNLCKPIIETNHLISPAAEQHRNSYLVLRNKPSFKMGKYGILMDLVLHIFSYKRICDATIDFDTKNSTEVAIEFMI